MLNLCDQKTSTSLFFLALGYSQFPSVIYCHFACLQSRCITHLIVSIENIKKETLHFTVNLQLLSFFIQHGDLVQFVAPAQRQPDTSNELVGLCTGFKHTNWAIIIVSETFYKVDAATRKQINHFWCWGYSNMLFSMCLTDLFWSFVLMIHLFFFFLFYLVAIFPAGETKKTQPEWQRDPETSTRNSKLHAAGRTGCLSKWWEEKTVTYKSYFFHLRECVYSA